MIWFDLVTPKSVMFFAPVIEELQKNNKVLITSRGDKEYNEINQLLKNKGLQYYSFGGYGGENLKDKLDFALKRQKQLNEFIQDYNISKLINLCSVDGCRVAFGNGIEIINFCDFPTGKDDKITHVARLTLPLSSKIFYPFYIPKDIFRSYCNDIIEYDFLDPVIYLQNQVSKRCFFDSLNLDKSKKTILFREEEYMSSYVNTKTSFAQEVLQTLDINLIIIPRYENSDIKQQFKNACILEQKIELSHILPFVDLFIGGGGTINIEAVYWEIPTISTRSFLCHYDRYLINKGLMHHANNKQNLINLINKLLYNKIKRSLDVKNVNIKLLIKHLGL